MVRFGITSCSRTYTLSLELEAFKLAQSKSRNMAQILKQNALPGFWLSWISREITIGIFIISSVLASLIPFNLAIHLWPFVKKNSYDVAYSSKTHGSTNANLSQILFQTYTCKLFANSRGFFSCDCQNKEKEVIKLLVERHRSKLSKLRF